MKFSSSLFNFPQRVELFKLKYPLEYQELIHDLYLSFESNDLRFTIYQQRKTIFKHVPCCAIFDTITVYDQGMYREYLIDSVSKRFFLRDSQLSTWMDTRPLCNPLFKKMLGIKSNINKINRYLEFYLNSCDTI